MEIIETTDLDITTSLHPRIIAKHYPKFWKRFINIGIQNESLSESFEAVEKALIESCPTTSELDRPFIRNFLYTEGALIPFVIPSYKRDDHQMHKWYSYYQALSSDGVSDSRIGLGDFETHCKAETAAFYKCLDIIEERL
jgi:hypothetical protein